jgi:hypothetical protein
MHYIALPTVRRLYTKVEKYTVKGKITKGGPYSVFGIDDIVDSDKLLKDKVGNGVYFKVHLDEHGNLVHTPLQVGSRDYNKVAKWVGKSYNPQQNKLLGEVYSRGHALFNNTDYPYRDFSTKKHKKGRGREVWPLKERHLPSAIKTETEVIALLKAYAALQAVQ